MFEHLKHGISRVIRSRVLILMIMISLMTAVLLHRLFQIQIISGES